MPAMNHWHKSLLVTGQPGSVAVLKELGGDVRVGVSKYWLPKRSGVFQPSVPLSPPFIQAWGVFSVVIHRAPGRETVVQDAPLQLW